MRTLYDKSRWTQFRRPEIRALQAFQIRADLRAVPVLRTDDLAANDAVSVDDVGLRPALGMKELGGLLGRVADRGQVHVVANEKAVVSVRVFVDADGQNGQIGPVVVQFEQRGHLLDAGRAPCGPEVEQHHAAPIAGQMDSGRAVGDCEVGCCLACLCRMGATVAAGGEGQRHKQSE